MKLNRLVNTILATAIIVGSFFSANSVQAQIENDTINAEGEFFTKDQLGNVLADQDIFCTPYLMQGDTIPDSTWKFTTDISGLTDFKFPAYIDLETTIFEQNYTAPKSIAFPNPGSDINIGFVGEATSYITAYKISGEQVATVKANYNPAKNISSAYFDLSKVADGFYVIKAETENGVVSKTISKRGRGTIGDMTHKISEEHFALEPNNKPSPKFKDVKNFIAEYIIEMDREGFAPFKDTLSFTDGDNGLVDLIMQKNPIVYDTTWGDGFYKVMSEEFTSIQNEDIFCTPVVMPGDTIPDTTYIFTTNSGGSTPFELPVSIDESKSEASYAIHITHEGYYDFDDTITIVEGDNGLISLIMDELPGIPQFQYVGGIFYNEQQEPLEGATVEIYDLGLNELLGEATTQTDGSYLFEEPLATNTDFYFKAGGIEGKFADVGKESSTPQTITTLSDTIKDVYHFTLYDKVREVPNEGGATVTPTAIQMQELMLGSNVEYSLQGNIYFYFKGTWTETQKETIRNYKDNGEVLFGMQEGTFTEVNYELNNVNFMEYNAYTNPMTGQIGVNIESGGNETDIYQVSVTTPLGNSFITTPAAEMNLSGNEEAAYKEFFLRLFYGNQVVSRPSWANPTPSLPDFLDRAIQYTINNHHINVYENQTAYFNIRGLAENMSENKNTSTTYKLPFKDVPLPGSNK